MNQEMAMLISNGFRDLGSWPVSKSIRNKGLLHEPFIRKRQRTAAVQDASEGQELPGFRQVLDCASPLALWLPLQKWIHGSDACPMLEVEALQELNVVQVFQPSGSGSFPVARGNGGLDRLREELDLHEIR